LENTISRLTALLRVDHELTLLNEPLQLGPRQFSAHAVSLDVTGEVRPPQPALLVVVTLIQHRVYKAHSWQSPCIPRCFARPGLVYHFLLKSRPFPGRRGCTTHTSQKNL